MHLTATNLCMFLSLFVPSQALIEGCDHQDTDTHWRCKKGKGSFNWRMKFDVELGHNSRAMKFPYLRFQVLLQMRRSLLNVCAFGAYCADTPAFVFQIGRAHV